MTVLPANADAVRLFVRAPWRHGPDGRPLGLDWQQSLALAAFMDVAPATPLLDKLLLMQETALAHFHAGQPAS